MGIEFFDILSYNEYLAVSENIIMWYSPIRKTFENGQNLK